MEKDLYMDKELTSALYRDADQWQLDRERKAVVARLQAVNPSELCGSHETLSAICKAVRQPVMGWTVGACELLRNRLIALMGGTLDAQNASFFAGNQQNGPKSGEKAPEMQRDEPKSRDSLQEVEPSSIADERNKVVCELRKLRDRGSVWGRELVVALGLSVEATNDDFCDRLIYLLGGDDGTASNDDRTCPIAVQSPSITDELRMWVRNHIWQYANKHIELIAIADRIDKQFERVCSQQEAVLQQTISETIDEHECEMDELRADYEQAISDITGVERGEGSDLLMPVDVYLHVRDGFRHDVEMWRDRAEDMRVERDDLQAELRVANQTHECNRKLAKRNEQWCDALLDLIRDAAKDYQECQRLLRVFKCHVKDVRHNRDELLDKLQAISVLCEQDDG